MVPPGVEVRIVVDNHPSYGPTVSFGLGGLYADAIGDVHRRAAPITAAEASALVGESMASSALAAVGVTPESLVPLVQAAGRLADEVWQIDRLVLNPVLVSEAGAWVVDATGTFTDRPEPQAGLTRHV
jgi:hypothetical protein